ncbi:MAG: hypothetical protein JJU29_18335 [Verrucomicrobia bacterium]|nr:hypothetical protein [Verrucomicrobiota bacterium]MCH8512888.1 hypothetical protein [Kiritimatiellia bacterium]
MDDRLKSSPYLGREWIVEKTDSQVRYVHCNFLALNKFSDKHGTVESETVPGGENIWTGAGLELGYGHKYILRHTDKAMLWTSLEVHYKALRFVEHVSGPDGTHDHSEDPHNIEFKNGVGLMGRLGYGSNREKTDGKARFFGPELGLGIVFVDDLGFGYQADLRILHLLW